MQTLDYIKLVLLFLITFVIAPGLGYLIREKRWLQKVVFFALCFSCIGGFFQAAEWGFTILPQVYRGHARGFHFFLTDLFAEALIFAFMTAQWKRFKVFPPGFWIWVAYSLACFLSIINAPVPEFTLFAAIKSFKILLILVAVYNYLHTTRDVHFLLTSLTVTLLWELVAVLKLKYVDHVYQVYGTFEHQNSLCMFAMLAGLVFLGVALGPKHPRSNFYLLGFVACAAIVQSTLSRGGLIIFGFGTAFTIFASLFDRPTKRRLNVMATVSVVGIVGLIMTWDTILSRFNDYGNDESKHTRDMLNISSEMMLRDYPLGIGWNNFAITINHPFPYGDHIDAWQRANNNPVDRAYKKGVVESLYWLHLAETGYQGLFFLLLFMAMFLFYNARAILFFRNEMLGAVSIGVFAGCSMNYMQSFLERVLMQPRNMILWFIFLALTGKIELWRRAEKKARKLDRAARRALAEQLPHARSEQELESAGEEAPEEKAEPAPA